jgi:hypothetical protein
MVLSIGETVTQVTDSGFLISVEALAVQAMAISVSLGCRSSSSRYSSSLLVRAAVYRAICFRPSVDLAQSISLILLQSSFLDFQR